jgi:hypothetical protein
MSITKWAIESHPTRINLYLPILENMPPTNYDASELIRRRNARTLALYNAGLQNYRNTVNINSSRTEQSSYQVLSVVTQRQLGNCSCVDSFVRRGGGAICGSC